MNHTDTTTTRIAVIGAGNIGGAMARGLARGNGKVSLYNRSASRLDAFKDTEGIVCLTTDIEEAIKDAGIIVICVEGHAVEPVIELMGKHLGDMPRIIVSCTAASSTTQLEALAAPYLPDPKIVRVLPNIGATCGASVNLVCSSPTVSNEEEAAIRELFAATGKCYSVEERLFAAAMAISSCGIANVLRYVRAATEAGVELGLSPELAKNLAAGSLSGTAAILEHTGLHPEALVDSVTTPGGLTIRGINTMEANGFSAAVIAGITAAAKKQ